MKIWLINHYAVPPQYYPLARQTNFAKYLKKMGHEVTIFAASTVHNSDINLIEDKSLYRDDYVDGIHYVYIRCKNCGKSMKKRILNMYEFSRKLPKVCNRYDKPDAIVATSMPPMSCAKGIKLARRYGCKAIAEIADLWPESIISYDIAGPHNPAIIYLRHLEKWIYKNAERIVFTMEGAYDYIIEQGWEKFIPRDKIDYINNGIDRQLFEYNSKQFITDDVDLENSDVFKVVYTGAIRKVNNVGMLLDTAKLLKDYPVAFLIWGDGDELPMLKQRIIDEKINNVVFKGRVDKKYIPYIISKADLNVMQGDSKPILRFGISPNKLFDYFGAGKPVLSTFQCKYNPADKFDAGTTVRESTPECIASEIIRYSQMPRDEYARICNNALKAAQEYDFANLTIKLVKLINGM